MLMESLTKPLDGLGRPFESDTGGEHGHQGQLGVQAPNNYDRQDQTTPTAPSTVSKKKQMSSGHGCQSLVKRLA